MTSDSESLQIVRVYEEVSAPTGEGTKYECSDGSLWWPVRPFERPAGDVRGDRIYPYPNRRG